MPVPMTMKMIRIIEEFVGKNLWEFILVNINVFYPCMYIIFLFALLHIQIRILDTSTNTQTAASTTTNTN